MTAAAAQHTGLVFMARLVAEKGRQCVTPLTVSSTISAAPADGDTLTFWSETPSA
jgi:hypothetical protein